MLDQEKNLLAVADRYSGLLPQQQRPEQRPEQRRQCTLHRFKLFILISMALLIQVVFVTSGMLSCPGNLAAVPKRPVTDSTAIQNILSELDRDTEVDETTRLKISEKIINHIMKSSDKAIAPRFQLVRRDDESDGDANDGSNRNSTDSSATTSTSSSSQPESSPLSTSTDPSSSETSSSEASSETSSSEPPSSTESDSSSFEFSSEASSAEEQSSSTEPSSSAEPSSTESHPFSTSSVARSSSFVPNSSTTESSSTEPSSSSTEPSSTEPSSTEPSTEPSNTSSEVSQTTSSDESTTTSSSSTTEESSTSATHSTTSSAKPTTSAFTSTSGSQVVVGYSTVISNSTVIAYSTMTATPTASVNHNASSDTTSRTKRIAVGCSVGLGIPIIAVALAALIIYRRRQASQNAENYVDSNGRDIGIAVGSDSVLEKLKFWRKSNSRGDFDDAALDDELSFGRSGSTASRSVGTVVGADSPDSGGTFVVDRPRQIKTDADYF